VLPATQQQHQDERQNSNEAEILLTKIQFVKFADGQVIYDMDMPKQTETTTEAKAEVEGSASESASVPEQAPEPEVEPDEALYAVTEYEDVAGTEDLVATSANNEVEAKGQWITSKRVMIPVSAGISLAAIIIFLCFCFCFRRSQRSHSHSNKNDGIDSSQGYSTDDNDIDDVEDMKIEADKDGNVTIHGTSCNYDYDEQPPPPGHQLPRFF